MLFSTANRRSRSIHPRSQVDEASPIQPSKLSGARRAKIPPTLRPMLATLVDKPFSSKDWLFEIKWDGVRALAWIENGRVELRSRTRNVITRQYPELRELPEQVGAKTAILDGEIVTLDKDGRSNFQALQSRMNVATPSEALQERVPVCYYVFDLPYCDGYDLRETPLLERKNLLRRVLESRGRFMYADHVLEKGKELLEVARERGLEGVIGKRADSTYQECRSVHWVKFKITQEVDAVIGGYTAGRGSRGEHFGALLLGLYEGGELLFVGGVGTGFDYRTQQAVYAELQKHRTEQCPFSEQPRTREKAWWVEPVLVATVRYSNWTSDRHLRAPVFVGLRKDYPAAECQFQKEMPVAATTLENNGKRRSVVTRNRGNGRNGANGF